MIVDKTVQSFGRLFTQVETLYAILLGMILVGIGVWAVATSNTYNKRGLEKEHYGFMFIGGGIVFIMLALLFAYAVSTSPRLAGIAGFGGLLKAIGM